MQALTHSIHSYLRDRLQTGSTAASPQHSQRISGQTLFTPPPLPPLLPCQCRCKGQSCHEQHQSLQPVFREYLRQFRKACAPPPLPPPPPCRCKCTSRSCHGPHPALHTLFRDMHRLFPKACAPPLLPPPPPCRCRCTSRSCHGRRPPWIEGGRRRPPRNRCSGRSSGAVSPEGRGGRGGRG